MSFSTLLLILLAIQTVGPTFFHRFATEVSPWSLLSKWVFIHAATIAFYFWVGAWSLAVPLIMLVLGVGLHTIVCIKYGIHPLRATPRHKYYAFRGWAWPPE